MPIWEDPGVSPRRLVAIILALQRWITDWTSNAPLACPVNALL
jgi:hypothetical protein